MTWQERAACRAHPDPDLWFRLLYLGPGGVLMALLPCGASRRADGATQEVAA